MRHHPEVMAALRNGIPAYNAKLTELEAAQQREQADRTESEHTLWATRDGRLLTDGYRVPVQTSVVHRPWSSFPDHQEPGNG